MKKNIEVKGKKFMPLNLQFFAESGSEAGSESGSEDNPNNSGENDDNEDDEGEENRSKPNKNTVYMTQEELSRKMTKEKKEGRMAILRELGIKVDDVKTNKEVMDRFKEWNETQKTDAQKMSERIAELENVEKENALLKVKIEALSMGANPSTLDDLISLATSKVDEENDIKAVMESLKTKYSMFFTPEISQSAGTGSSRNNSRQGAAKETTLAERLAKSREKQNEQAKNNNNMFFRH